MLKPILCAWALLGVALVGGTAVAGPIDRIIVVQTTDLPAYLKEVDTLRGQFKKAGVAVTLRVFRATYAGPEAGAIVVAVEVADLATLGKVNELQKSNADISATLGRIGKLRKIVSDSLYEELSP
jgi:hypothetical protein